MNKPRVLVGMSGGVDSSAVCMLLQEQGYEVVGLTMRMWDVPSQFAPGAEEPGFVLEARQLAERLGIEHHTLDIRSEFRQTVIRNFIDEYMQGHTPNPCVMCNLFFKWKYLLDTADKLNCETVATGHYARIIELNGKLHIAKGIDDKKDQSYFLWRLGQKELSRTQFPLGAMKKEEIKAYVLAHGFREKAEKKESMEVCFVEKDYRTFLREQLPQIDQQVGAGDFVDEQGKKLGAHKGFPFYTIGQRKGLEIALGEPAYVVRINPAKNTIRLGKKEELLENTMVIKEMNVPDVALLADRELSVRIRYRSKPESATVEFSSENGMLLRFTQPASAVTPGQSAVIYHDDIVIGGGIIADVKEKRKFKASINRQES
ncbi:MAG: tRNA 2-thiouridine(34) synthase MnmA [Bacteroidales bacterium]